MEFCFFELASEIQLDSEIATASAVAVAVAMDVAAFTADLVARGIDIVVPCDVRWYNAHVAEHALPLRPLPNF